MKISVIGLSHLGEVYSACLAELGNQVIGVDENTKVVNNLNKGIAPLKEPGLEKIIKRNIKKGQLKYSTDFSLLSSCNTVWITIDIPLDKQARGSVKKILIYLKKALPHFKNECLLIVSSQVPAGTSLEIIEFINKHRKNFMFSYAHIPENLRLGEAVNGFMRPSRIIIGIDDSKRKTDLIKLFKKLKTNIFIVSVASAEMIKHATNAFLATCLSFIYDIADVCEKVGADVTQVSRGLRADGRIGEKAYLDASAGFSGGHLERDLQYLRKIAKIEKIGLPVINSVVKKNKGRRKIVFSKITPLMKTFKGKTITFFGITYKSGTPTLVHSLPLMLAKECLTRGSKINLCDPWVNSKEITKEVPANKFNYFADPYESVKSSSVIICLTPWAELKKLDYGKIARLMIKPKIFFDARNYFLEESNIIKKAGINYIGVGR